MLWGKIKKFWKAGLAERKNRTGCTEKLNIFYPKILLM